MSKVLLVKEGDSVAVVVPTSQTAEELQKQYPNSKIVDSDSLPRDRTFRDAWTMDGTIDIPKAIEIWKNKIRKARAKKMAKLDIEWMKAIEKGNVTIAATFAADKEILRNLTNREELTKAKTVDEITSFWPAILE